MSQKPQNLVAVARILCERVDALEFGPPVHMVYNPLRYAWKPHEQYLKRYGAGLREVVLVGMNPGPWGMVQTGVPFGDVQMARDWLGIEESVSAPEIEHPKRPIQGFGCARSEVSGTRLWGWAQRRFATPEAFFSRFFVWNYCPLCFMEESGRNFTPDKLKKHEQEALFSACNDALAAVCALMQPRFMIGIGKFAADRIHAVCDAQTCVLSRIPHPSPASPAANRDWAGAAEAALLECGVPL